MSRRKISSESFSSLGSDYLETSPEEEGECPLSRLCWNGSRSPPGPPERSAAAAAAAAPAPAASAAAATATAGARRAQRRRRVNLDSLGESISRLTAPSVSRGGRGASASGESAGIGKVGAGQAGRAHTARPLGGGRASPRASRAPRGPGRDPHPGLWREGA